MEHADEDLSHIETQLRELAAQDRARPQDADLMARLLQQADVACGKIRKRTRFPWLPLSALAAGLAVLAVVPLWWYGQNAPVAARSEEPPSAPAAASLPLLATAEPAPVMKAAAPAAVAMDALPAAPCNVLPQSIAGHLPTAVAVVDAVECEEEAECADDAHSTDYEHNTAVAVYSGAAEEDADMPDAAVADEEIPPWLCETATAPSTDSLAVANVIPNAARSWSPGQKKALRSPAPRDKAKPKAAPPIIKKYAAKIWECVNRAQKSKTQH